MESSDDGAIDVLFCKGSKVKLKGRPAIIQ